MQILRAARANNRVYARPQDWALVGEATDFMLPCLTDGSQTAGSAHELVDYGWTVTSVTQGSGSTADFLLQADSSSDMGWSFDGVNDELLSPQMFGSYWRGQLAAETLGYSPTKLIAEIIAVWTTATANETITGFGFSTGTGLTGTNHVAYIYTDGSNFSIRNQQGSDVGAADDALFHVFRIEMTQGGSIEWFIDSTSQGTIPMEQDKFPTRFAASSSTTNRFTIVWGHIWYE